MKKTQKFYGEIKYRDWDDKIFFLQNSLAVAHLLEQKIKSKGFCFFEVFDDEEKAHLIYPDAEIGMVEIEEKAEEEISNKKKEEENRVRRS